MADMTPMMRQYMEIKQQNPDSILFFRLGDFYEMFDADARTASRELDLTLTTRDKDKNKSEEEKVPMCGIPYHSSEAYIARLIAKGYKVAICEQTEDPALAKGLVKRDVLRVITPGTVMDASCLEEGRSNFCAGIFLGDDCAALAVCDVSTGKTLATAFSGTDHLTRLINELGRFSPVEAVLNEGAYFNETLRRTLEERFSCHMEKLAGACFRTEAAEKLSRQQFGEDALSRLPRDNGALLPALGGLLYYLHETQKTDLRHIDTLEYYTQGQFMELDLTARRNLELTETLRSKEKKGSLLWVLDKTKTAMGGRMLRSWLERPLLHVTEIQRRLDAVSALVDATVPRRELIEALSGIADMERLIGRIVYGTAGARELVSLRGAMERLPLVKAQLSSFPKGRLHELDEALDDLNDLASLIGQTLVDAPPFSVREGEMIREGFHPEVDRLREILHGGKSIITRMEAEEKEKTGIRTLRIGYNKVFGYYIEVSNSFRDQVPDTYIRKQTLVNGERYITQELKDLESDILSAADRVGALEFELFNKLRLEIASHVGRIQRSASAVAELDVFCALAAVAVKNNYCCPSVDESGRIEISDGRHAVVEQMRADALFVPNDTCMGAAENRVAIITGPNMAGKSTYMRQVALIVLLSQIGSFVPARSAHIGVVDRIFTRIGASDDLSAGQSTFMVEMSEVSEILRHATSRSLLILDEIGRGTSTFDGMSIARAVLEYCADSRRLGAKTLFATHYHELTELEDTLPGVKNYNIAVRARGEEIIFLRKILPGGADRSYGIEVAQLAGLPKLVIQRAREVLRDLESAEGKAPAALPQDDQLSFSAMAEQEAAESLRRAQVDTFSPLEALQFLYELKKKLDS
ncbi:MAG: DNA mismatch repair protein MutS [Oscillospiraceae bacterium]|nr:DNA mismatch repair protein MutS [Oscillospiraceae bacterium]